MTLCLLLTALVSQSPGTAATAEDVVVMDLRSQSLGKAQRRALTDLVLYGVSKRRAFRKVIGMDDVKAQLSRDALKQAIECDDSSCAAEIGAALGARHLITMNANPLGNELVVSISLIDSRTQASKRALAKVHAKKQRTWSAAMESALNELFGQTAATPQALPNANNTLEIMVSAMTPKCAELDVQGSIDGAAAMEKHMDWDTMPDHEWPGTRQAFGYHWVVIAHCGPKAGRPKARKKAQAIFEGIAERAPEHSIRPMVDAYLEVLKRSTP
ncbi:MAG: hypothetical protein AAFQ82_05545 [Myxococcota bacterium]